MPRKKKADAGAVAVAETEIKAAAPGSQDDRPPIQRPAYIDGPPVTEDGRVIRSDNPGDEGQETHGKHWGPPYKSIFSCKEKGFEMGENRRFVQRLFKFNEKPSEEILAELKAAGFTYRAAEKTWTIHATPDTRSLSDDLAKKFAGQSAGFVR